MVITVSRQMGSLGDEAAEALSAALQCELITKERVLSEWLPESTGAFERNLLAESPKFYFHQAKDGITYKEHIEKRMAEFTAQQSCVVVGMGAHRMLLDNPGVVHICITAPWAVRLERIRRQYQLAEVDAEALLTRVEKSSRRFLTTLYGEDAAELSQFDLVLNTASLTVDGCVRLIQSYLAERREPTAAELEHQANPPAFKHPAEMEFAKILDMYNIEWQYEPKTFPVEWDSEGNVTLAFRPDFYLTKFDTYIEITTMSQKHVTTKNKKVRKLRELYPGIHIHIVYKKDFHTLLKRFESM